MNPQGTYNPQSGGTISLQGSSYNPQQTYSGLQVTANPQTSSFSSPQGATTQSTTTGTGTTYYDQAAADAAALQAQRTAQANAIKSTISGIVNSVKGAYDAIYGDLNTVGADKTRSVNQKYNNENTALVDQYNTDFPQIGNAYASRGVYDSSYRQDSEAGANKQYNNMLDQLQTGRTEDLAKVGQWVDTQRAQVGADGATLNSLEALIAQSTDPDQLASYQQQISQKLADITASRAGLRSQAAYKQTADSLVDSTDQSAGLRGTLSAIVAGAAPAPLKRSTAMKLVQSSGLPPEVQNQLISDFDKQLSGTSDQTDQTVVPGA